MLRTSFSFGHGLNAYRSLSVVQWVDLVHASCFSAGQLYVQNSISDHNGPSNGKQVSTSDIQRVQNYIEKCLQMYLTQKEVRCLAPDLLQFRSFTL